MRRLIRTYLFPILQAIVRPFFALPPLRKISNVLYLPLGFTLHFLIHKVFGRAFRDRRGEPPAGSWQVRFAGRLIKMPLRKGWFWLDWETALSILGHEHFIKQKYAALIASASRPALFVDIGANFGTHSLLFMAHGIPALSFEPNPTCEEYFREACALNGFTSQWNAVALGAAAGEIELVYPEKETWVGTTTRERQSIIEGQGALIRQTVPLKVLDSFVSQLEGQRVFIKIDTEGAELDILRGASLVLTTVQPLVIFESVVLETRPSLYDLLTAYGYTIATMEWMPNAPSTPLTREAFVSSGEFDFMAVPPTSPKQEG